MDNEMPVMTGLESSIKIHQFLVENKLVHIPIFIASGESHLEVLSDASYKGIISGTLPKPISHNDLLKVVRKYLNA